MTIWTDLSPVPFSLSYVDAGGVRTRTLRAGDGAPVVFLHGTSGHLEAFTRNIAAHAEHYAVHAIDMLGHGYTGKPGHPYEIPLYVKHLLDYLDAVGVEKAHIVGESLGGWVGARAAADFPDRVASLQLLCAGGTVANPEVMQRIDSSTRQAVATDDVELTRKRLRLLMADPADATEELVEVRHRIYHEPGFVAGIDNLLSLQKMEIRRRNLLTTEQMARISRPTLIVWGRKNPFGDVPEAQAMHEAIPGSRLELFDDTGHWPQHEQAARYNPLSLEFLAKVA
ncbi:alpha/beta fold hydrolase [Paractinoplanes brasiliensis]|uniref:2-hydroxy-6-oxonona-2,4-dienedioate hydrolase n=1 Tax=Paractinoplanes brasiliensis TaxID=52695 RepID=A0A4R6JM28_9ACTN|nr:alpha/beta fold hydrolase [Actinoplanes brasiliensis]TDO37370.1 2-hydroxy-6-oxonona-2,4-dienedioate hydrolase [Actinoplanes brasiliensis]GID29313.1 2-hydroxy-6-ketonona-2,4-dienedioic acid hydrolase [Actinoplanes brasiliensis]